jgi:glycine oxidase
VDVTVVGAGIIGLSIAWRAAQAGLAVTVVDPDPASCASHAAAGMLTPVSEAHYGEEALLALNLASAARWPAFAADLAAASGMDVPLRSDGSLLVAFDDDDLRALEELRRFQAELGLDVARLRSRECRDLEPLLSPRIRGGVRVDGEASVDNRAACRALLAAAEAAGVGLVRERVVEVVVDAGRATGVRLASGATLGGDRVVVAAGPWSAQLAGLPATAVPPVRPVKGQILRLRFDPADPPVTRNIRGLARGWSVYLVPRTSGELVVGATVEEQGFDASVTAGAVRELLEAAIDVVPAVGELELVEAIARLRPATPDNAPIIGSTPVDGLVLATGHHRNGVLLAPITADAVVGLLADGVISPEAAPFGIERFAR